MPYFIRILLSLIFLASAVGKWLDPTSAALNLSELFFLPDPLARTAAMLLSVAEIAIIPLLWFRSVSRYLIAIPVVFLMVYAYSYIQNRECGCFGSLPVLSELPFLGHGFLLVGMLGAFIYLSYFTPAEPGGKNRAVGTVLSGASLLFLTAALLSIPLSHTGPAPPEDITIEELNRLIDGSEVALIDARTPFEYAIGHIPGAINIPYDSDSLEVLYESMGLHLKPIIVYCAGVHCNKAELLAERLRALGHRAVRVFAGGWEAWMEFESRP